MWIFYFQSLGSPSSFDVRVALLPAERPVRRLDRDREPGSMLRWRREESSQLLRIHFFSCCAVMCMRRGFCQRNIWVQMSLRMVHKGGIDGLSMESHTTTYCARVYTCL